MRNRFGCWLTLAPFLICGLAAETTIIDAGSPTDSFFTGGTVYTIPSPPAAVTDATMRFGTTFRYEMPAQAIPYIVTFRFVEPSVQAAGQRVFSVKINNQPVIDRLDLVAEAGYLKPLERSVIVMGVVQCCLQGGSQGWLKIAFDAQVRSAVVSSIEIRPLGEVPVPTAENKALHDAAWTVINTRCTRCHGDMGPPPDTALTFAAIRGEVGDLDLRTRASMLVGGSRGPALRPGDLFGSRIFLFASRCQTCMLTQDMSGAPVPPIRDLMAAAQVAGFAYIPSDSSEDSVGMPPYAPLSELELAALRDWIIAGAP